jgi:hypothetical protein
VYNDPAAGESLRDPIRPGNGAAPGPDTVAPATTATATPDRATDPRVCIFLRVVDADEWLGPPIDAPDPANRCVALREPVPQSLRQQELVCLSSGHVNCPRYLRGALDVEPARPVRTPRSVPTVTVSRATAGALAVFAVAFVLSVAFVLANGGVVLTAVAPTSAPSGGVLGAIETAPPTEAPTPAPTAEVSPDPTASASIEPTASAGPTASVEPSDTPEPTTPPPSATPDVFAPSPPVAPTSKPTSGRYALLTACPDRSGCWIYHIRSGDNLFSIANYFGVSLKTVQAWNPWTQSGLKVGRELRIPTPTR